MARQAWVQLAAGVTALGCLAGSGALAVQLAASAGRHRLVYTDTVTEGQPPQVALGIAMGAFRGMFVNFLWIRANELKEAGRYYEAIDLARAITQLQPRFPHVWVFHAWNLAYNISVQTYTNRERWKWVSAGINLLRTQAVKANPNDLFIHKELAWILLHKVGGFMDDANLYYKRQLAAEWTFNLGPPPPPDARDRDLETVTAKYVAWLRPLADAPDTLEALLAASPQTRTLVDRLRDETGFQPDWKVVRNYTTMRAILDSGEREIFERAFDERRRKFAAMVEDPALADAWPPLIAHLRRRIVVDQYNMDPQRMIRFTEKFGPLDWRHYAAHSIYWAERGVENAYTRWTDENRKDFDFVNTGRMVVHSLQELWRSGDLYFDFLSFIKNPDDERVFYRGSPNIHFIDTYGRFLNDHIERMYRDQDLAKVNFFEDPRRRAFTLYASGYENFRKDAIRFLYRRGEIDRAERMKNELAVWPYHNVNDPDRAHLFSLSIGDFVQKELEDQLSRPTVAREEIVGALQGAFINGLLGRDTRLFEEQFRYAALVHGYFFNRQTQRTQLDPTVGRQGQFPRDFRLMAGTEFAAMCSVLDLDAAETLYDAAPEDLKRWGYDILASRFREGLAEMQTEVRAQGREFRGFDRRFPEPAGLAEHRAMLARLQAEGDQAQINPDIK